MSPSTRTDSERDRAGEHAVWYPDDPGYRRSIDSAGAVAAPLLAGFSFTLLALLLPTIDSRSTTTTSTGIEVTRSDSFSGAPEIAALLLLLAGVFLIASVQAAMTMRRHAWTPGEMEEWYPHYFRESVEPTAAIKDVHDEEGVPVAAPGFWKTDEQDGWVHRQVGQRWYGAWIRREMQADLTRAGWWADWTRRLYNSGVVALLSGLTAMVWPPSDHWTTARTALAGVAGAAVVIEGLWIVAVSWRSDDR